MPTHHKGTAEKNRVLDAFIKLTRCTEVLMSRLINYGSLEGLTVSQFGVLEALLHLGLMNQSEIGSKLLHSGRNITLVIDNLEKQELVHRQRDDHDRRMVFEQQNEAAQTA